MYYNAIKINRSTTCTGNMYRTFGEVRTWCMDACGQTDRQTLTYSNADHNSP